MRTEFFLNTQAMTASFNVSLDIKCTSWISAVEKQSGGSKHLLLYFPGSGHTGYAGYTGLKNERIILLLSENLL